MVISLMMGGRLDPLSTPGLVKIDHFASTDLGYADNFQNHGCMGPHFAEGGLRIQLVGT